MPMKLMSILLPLFILTSTRAASAMSPFRENTSSPEQAQPKMCLGEGEIGYVKGLPALPNMPCCSGLKEREIAENHDKGCKQACGGRIEGEITSFVCITCGDKKCDRRFESPYNCPEDCK